MVSIAGEFPAGKAVIPDPMMNFEFFFLLFDIDAGVKLYLKFIRFLLKIRSFGLMEYFWISE